MPAVGPLREVVIELPMKRPGLTPLILAATLFLAGGLRAEEAPTPPPAGPPQAKGRPAPPPMQPGGAAEILRRFDKNGDGKLTREELRPARPEGAPEGAPEGGRGRGGPGGADGKKGPRGQRPPAGE